MAFRFRPFIRTSWGSITTKSINLRTGVPGLSYQVPIGSGTTDGAQPTSYRVKLPNRPDAIYNIFFMAGLILLVSLFFWFLGSNQFIAIIIPFLYIPSILVSLFSTYTYDEKEVPIKKNDGRYKGGYKIVGTKVVSDKSKKIYFTPEQKQIERLEGLGKLLIGALTVYLLWTYAKPADPIPPKSVLKINGLYAGINQDSVKILIKGKHVVVENGDVVYQKVSYAGEPGTIKYSTQNGKLKTLEFNRRPFDKTSFFRIKNLLIAKYGVAQDSAQNQYTWRSDSLELSLKLINNEVEDKTVKATLVRR